MKFQLAQYWPLIVAVWEAILTGLVAAKTITDPDLVAYLMGVPATVGLAIGVKTHASKTVLDELAAGDA